MITKIWKTVLFMVVLFISVLLSGLIILFIGDKVFKAFPPGCSEGMICVLNIQPISVWQYPYNLLFGIFVLLVLVFTYLFTYLMLRYIFK